VYFGPCVFINTLRRNPLAQLRVPSLLIKLLVATLLLLSRKTLAKTPLPSMLLGMGMVVFLMQPFRHL
jgi:hypothetical protein